MVARDPDDVFEKGASSLEGKGELLGGFADVAAKNEAVVWMWRQCGQGFAIGFEAEVEVTEGIEAPMLLRWRRFG